MIVVWTVCCVDVDWEIGGGGGETKVREMWRKREVRREMRRRRLAGITAGEGGLIRQY